MGGVCSARDGDEDFLGDDELYEKMKNKTLITMNELQGVWFLADATRVEVDGNVARFIRDDEVVETEITQQKSKFMMTVDTEPYALLKDSLPYYRWITGQSSEVPDMSWRRTHLQSVVAVDMQPGPLGFDYKPESAFHIKKVDKKGQVAEDVQVGWFVLNVNGRSASVEAIEDAMNSGENYQMTFLQYEKKNRDDITFTDMQNQSVSLSLEKGVIYRYENGLKRVGNDKKGKVTTLFVGQNGELFDQTGYSGIDVDFEALQKLAAWCHIARIHNNFITKESVRYRRIDSGVEGFKINFKTGIVQEVEEESQFDQAGVKSGWKILMVDDHEYSQKVLKNALRGNKSFIVAFEEVMVEDTEEEIILEGEN